MNESTMICETAWSEAPDRVVFKGNDEWGVYVPEQEHGDEFYTARRIAEKVEAEQNALMMELCGPYTSVWRGMNAYAESVGMPMGYEESITSWLDRWFVPRPRYEDGASVQFGDEYYWADCTMRKITGFGQTENGAPYITCAFDGNGMSDAMIYSGFLKRPTPKALDADGVEIADDDVVYLLGDTRRLKVADPHAVDDCGDPVVECVVIDDGRGAGDYPDADVVACKASELTHREPDSLEKLRDDLDAFMRDCSINADKVDEFCDRLTALMERGV